MSARSNGMSPFRAGILALVIVGLFAYFGFTKANPFANPYEFKAAFNDVNNLKPKSPVRIAGVEVGKVKKVEPVTDGEGAAIVTMELKDKALPIHDDAELKIRPRIFLEGNFFVDLQPGSPSADELEDGETIPITQTAAPVQFGDVLTALQTDTRADLQTFLREYSKGLDEGGAEGFNEAIEYWEPAYRNSSLANDATLGQDPDRDLQRVLKGQQKTFGALVRDERALKDLVTNFNVTAGALRPRGRGAGGLDPRAARHAAGRASRRWPRSTPRCRRCAPSPATRCRACARRTRRSRRRCRSSRQARLLMSEKRAARHRAGAAPDDPGRGGAQPHLRAVPARGPRALGLHQQRARAVHAPQDPEPRVGQRGREQQPEGACQLQRGFPGLSGESRLSDGNNQFFHAGVTPPGNRVRPGPPPDGGSSRRRTAPTCPARPRSSRTCTRPAGRSRRSRSLEHSPGSNEKPPAPTPPTSSFLDSAQNFVDDVLPLVAKQRAAYEPA